MFFLEKYDLRYSKYAPAMCEWWGMGCCKPAWFYVMMSGTAATVGLTVRCDLYKPLSSAWSLATNISQFKRANQASGPAGDDIGVSAYGNGVNGLGVAGNELWTDAYTFSTDTWNARTDGVGTARTNLGQGMNSGTYLFVTGGSIGSLAVDANYLANTDRFNQSTNSWQASTNLSLNRMETPSIAVVDIYGFVIGGRKQATTLNVYTNNDKFNMLAETYAVETALATGRCKPGLYSMDDKLISATGSIKDPFSSSVINDPATLQFDPATSAWTTKSNITNTTNRPGCASSPSPIIGYIYGNDEFSTPNHQTYAYNSDSWGLGSLAGSGGTSGTGVRQVMGECGNGGI